MKFFLCVFLTLKLVSAQCPHYQWAPQEQNLQHQAYHYAQPHYQYEPQQNEEQNQADEPVVGSTLGLNPLGIKLANPFGLFGVPGLRFNNLNMGRVGSLAFSNSILGAENPNAEEAEYQVGSSQQQYPIDYAQQQFDPQVGAAQDNQGFHHHHWWFVNGQNEQQLGSPKQYQQDYQQNYEQYQPQLQQYHYTAPEPQYQYQQQPITTPQHLQNDDVQATADERSPWWDGSNYNKKIIIEKGYQNPTHHYDHHHDDHHDYHNAHYHVQPYYSKGFSKTYTKNYSKGYYQPQHYHSRPIYGHGTGYGYNPSYGYSLSAPDPSPKNDASNSNTEVVAKTEVEKSTTEKPKELKITTTYAPSTTTTKSTKKLTTQAATTEESTDTTQSSTTTLSTTEKSEKKETKLKSNALLDIFNTSRKRRSVSSHPPSFSIPSKRCINFDKSILYDTLLGASNPNIEDDVSARSDQEIDASENIESDDCQKPKPRPITTRPLKIISPEQTLEVLDRVSKPYFGMLNDGHEKLWSNGGIVGRFIGPLEDTYLEIIKQNEYEPQIQAIRVIT